MKTQTIQYSLGKSHEDNTPTQLTAGSFDEFQRSILSQITDANGGVCFCGLMSHGPHDDPLKYPAPAHYRLASHAKERRFICLDHDGYSDPSEYQEVLNDLKRFRGFAYTTKRHTSLSPRCKIVLELDRTVNREEGIQLGEAIERLFRNAYGEGAINTDKSGHRAEQYTFCPTARAEVFLFDGSALEVDKILELFPPELATEHNTPRVDEVNREIREYAQLTPESLVRALALIDPTPEPIWHDVSNALARAYGEKGRQYFINYSRGDYWTAPYPAFDEAEVNHEYDRSLMELRRRPDGYGVLRLLDLAGLDSAQVQFATKASKSTTTPLNVSNTGKPLILPIVGTRGQPLAVQENLLAVLTSQGVIARYNQIKKKPEVIVPGLSCVTDEATNTAYTNVTDEAIKAGLPYARIPELLDALAAKNPYCPVQTYFESRAWDEISRFDQFAGQIQSGDKSTTRFLLRKWLVQAVAAVYERNGLVNAGVLILSGAQGIGKTRLIRDLTSGVSDVFAEGVTLNPADKDSSLAAITHWIVELGELEATFRKSDIAQLKAFITRQVDTIRRPYAKKESNLLRRTVFVGTVNDLHCLHDTTGNRRFWPIEVFAIKRDETIDYQQLWAEALTWYRAGEKWYLSETERQALEAYSERFMVTDPDIENLLTHYDFFNCSVWSEETMRDICKVLDIEHATKAQTMRLAEAIRKYNGGKTPRVSNGKKYHYVPSRGVTLPPPRSPTNEPSKMTAEDYVRKWTTKNDVKENSGTSDTKMAACPQ